MINIFFPDMLSIQKLKIKLFEILDDYDNHRKWEQLKVVDKLKEIF